MDRNRMKTAGVFKRVQSIPGRRGCGGFPPEIGRHRCQSGDLPTRKRLRRAIRSAVQASVEYTKPIPGGSWSSSFIWGRKYSTASKRSSNSYLVESVLPIRRKNFITGRVELVDKDELFRDDPELEERLDAIYGSTFRVGAYTIGYTRDIDVFGNVERLTKCADGDRGKFRNVLAAGSDQAVLWRPPGRWKYFRSLSTEAPRITRAAFRIADSAKVRYASELERLQGSLVRNRKARPRS